MRQLLQFRQGEVETVVTAVRPGPIREDLGNIGELIKPRFGQQDDLIVCAQNQIKRYRLGAPLEGNGNTDQAAGGQIQRTAIVDDPFLPTRPLRIRFGRRGLHQAEEQA